MLQIPILKLVTFKRSHYTEVLLHLELTEPAELVMISGALKLKSYADDISSAHIKLQDVSSLLC